MITAVMATSALRGPAGVVARGRAAVGRGAGVRARSGPRRGDRGGAVVLWSALMVPVGVLGGVVALAVPQWLAADVSARDAAADVAGVALALNAGGSGPVVSVDEACDPVMLGDDAKLLDGVAERNSNYVAGLASGVLAWRQAALAELGANPEAVAAVFDFYASDEDLTAWLTKWDLPADASAWEALLRDAAVLDDAEVLGDADPSTLATVLQTFDPRLKKLEDGKLSAQESSKRWDELKSQASLLGTLLDLIGDEQVVGEDAVVPVAAGSPAREVSARKWPGHLPGESDGSGAEFSYVWVDDPKPPYEHWSARALLENFWIHEVEPARTLVTAEQAHLCVELMEAVYRDLGFSGIDSVGGYHTNPLGVAISAGAQRDSAGRWYVCGKDDAAAAVYVTLAGTWESAGWAASQVWPDGRQFSAEGAAATDVSESGADDGESDAGGQAPSQVCHSADSGLGGDDRVYDAREYVAELAIADRYPISVVAAGAADADPLRQLYTDGPGDPGVPPERPPGTLELNVTCQSGDEPASATEPPDSSNTVRCEFAAPPTQTTGAVDVAYTTMEAATATSPASQAESCTNTDGTHDYVRKSGTAKLDLDADPQVRTATVEVKICHDTVSEGKAPETLAFRWTAEKAEPTPADIACATAAPSVRSTACTSSDLQSWNMAAASINADAAPTLSVTCDGPPTEGQDDPFECEFTLSEGLDRDVPVAVTVGEGADDTAKVGAAGPCPASSSPFDLYVASQPAKFAAANSAADDKLAVKICDVADDDNKTFTVAWTATLGGGWAPLTGSRTFTIGANVIFSCDTSVSEPPSGRTQSLRCTHSTRIGSGDSSTRASRVMYVTLPKFPASQLASAQSPCTHNSADMRKSAAHQAVSSSQNVWRTLVTVCDDDLHEGDEQFELALYRQADATAQSPQARCVQQFGAGTTTEACLVMFDTWDKHTVTIVDTDRPSISMSCTLADGSAVPAGQLSEGDELACGFSTTVLSVHDTTLWVFVAPDGSDSTAERGTCANKKDLERVSSPGQIAAMSRDSAAKLRLRVCSEDGYESATEEFTVKWEARQGVVVEAGELKERGHVIDSGTQRFSIAPNAPSVTGCGNQALIEGQPARCSFTLSEPAQELVYVSVRVNPLSVTTGKSCRDAGVDVLYTKTKEVEIPKGSTQSLTAAIIGTCADSDLEPTEAFDMAWNATSRGGETIGTGLVRVQLTDAPELTAAGCDKNSFAYEGETVRCEIALVNTTTEAATVTVSLTTGPGTPAQAKTREVAATAALRGECGNAGVDYEQLYTGTAAAVTVPARALHLVSVDVVEVCVDDVHDNRELVDVTWQAQQVDETPGTPIGRGRRTLTLMAKPAHSGCQSSALESVGELQCFYVLTFGDTGVPTTVSKTSRIDARLESINAEVKPCDEGGDVEPEPDPDGIINEAGEYRAIMTVYLCDDDAEESLEQFWIYFDVSLEAQEQNIVLGEKLRYRCLEGPGCDCAVKRACDQLHGRQKITIRDDDIDRPTEPGS
ncbi:hypothetical protein [Candidatus Poriferisodalis sp.]|uniref:hypothetical protein n=1 Tax=Candidatus Poriferisodalis sp. TaxID=3101277 RepID=UPI003B012D3A